MVEVDLFIRIALFYTGRRTPGDCYQLSVRTTLKQQSIPLRAQMVSFAQQQTAASTSAAIMLWGVLPTTSTYQSEVFYFFGQ